MADKKLLTQDQAIALIRKWHRDSGMTLTGYAQSKGVTKQYLRNVLAKSQFPGPSLGFEKLTDVKFKQIEN